MQAELTRLKAELKKLTAHKQQLLDQLPGLCKQVASQQDTAVLQQDYNAKLLRQNYYISKKQAFAELLLQQHARHEFLNLAREEEVKRLQATQQELHLLHELLSDVRIASQQRMSHYASKQLQPSSQPQLVVHDDDSFLQTLDRLLPDITEGTVSADGSSKDKLYVSLEQLGQKLNALSQWDLKHEVQQQTKSMQAGPVISMQATFAQLHPLVFPTKATADPQLTAPEVEEAMLLAQTASFDLTAEVNRIAQQQQIYQNILHQQHKQLGAERAVFSMFHNQPEHLGLLAL